jgi:calcineurin-like phosphoesterase family protein
MDYVISDTHFGHSAIIKHCHRPFPNVREMDEIMIRNWNSVVGPRDTVHHGGDIAFRCSDSRMYEIITSLNGNIKLVQGDHDKDFLKMLRKRGLEEKVEVVGYMEIIKFNHEKITLCHWAMASWNRAHFNSFHIHGHHHGRFHGNGKSIDISVESEYINYTPISIPRVIEIMKTRPDNWNYIKNRRK